MLKIYLKIKVYFSVNNCDIIVESSCIFNKTRNPLNVNDRVKKETLKVRIVLENLRVRSSKNVVPASQSSRSERLSIRTLGANCCQIQRGTAGTATCL